MNNTTWDEYVHEWWEKTPNHCESKQLASALIQFNLSALADRLNYVSFSNASKELERMIDCSTD